VTADLLLPSRPRFSDDVLAAGKAQLRHGSDQLVEDLEHLKLGVLDPVSFRVGWTPVSNPVEVRTTSLVPHGKRVHSNLLCTDPAAYVEPVLRRDGTIGDARFDGRQRYVRQIRRQHNLQLTVGKNQMQRITMFGDVGTAVGLSGSAVTGSATTPTATTWTQGGTTFSTATTAAGNAGLQGHIVFVANAVSASAFTNPVLGVILSNTTSALTVDQWYVTPLTGAAGTTPAANSAAFVFPGGSIGFWIALSTSVTSPVATDVTRTADGLWGDGTSGGTATEQTANGLARAYAGQGGTTAPTIPGSAQIQFNHTWTYTGATGVTIGKVVLFNSLAAAGTIPVLETLLSATATVSTNGDTIQLSGWSITC
jgi:hypothetical protein